MADPSTGSGQAEIATLIAEALRNTEIELRAAGADEEQLAMRGVVPNASAASSEARCFLWSPIGEDKSFGLRACRRLASASKNGSAAAPGPVH